MNERANTSRWIEEILTGDRSLEDPEVLRWLEANPQAKSELEGLDDLTRLLDDAGREQRETLGDAREEREPPGSDRVSPRLEELIREESPERGGSAVPTGALGHPVRPRRLAPILFAAALLLVAPLVWWGLRSEPTPDAPRGDVYLGDEELAPRLERDAETGVWTLAWSFELPAGGWFSLELTEGPSPDDAQPLATVPRYTGTSWSLDSVFPEGRELPDRVFVSLTAYGPAGEVEDSWTGPVAVPAD